MQIPRGNIAKNLDWWTIILFVVLTSCGWFTICGASYDFVEIDFLDFATRSGKQFVWICCAYVLGLILLLIDNKTYKSLPAFIYGGVMLLLLVTVFVADEIKGSRSWLRLGSINLQPAEFAKFATSLMLAKVMSGYNFDMAKWRCMASSLIVIFIPIGLIIMQKETGSALVFLSFAIMFFREGLPSAIPLTCISMVVYFITGVKYNQSTVLSGTTQVGVFLVLMLIIAFTLLMMKLYIRKKQPFILILLVCILTAAGAVGAAKYYKPFDVNLVLYGLIAALVLYNIISCAVYHLRNFAWIALFAIFSVGFHYSSNHLFNNILQEHQRTRIEVLLGMKEDPLGASYNVNQSKIAIGSGGLMGKGFLNGTQTKLKYVPEQDTDFIFCTIGEEEGFLGAAGLLLIYLLFILRIIWLAERQNQAFERIYGYCVASIFLFHVFVNIGMVLGLVPVIGIPLPLISYGGSSLWGFTILLFIFLRLDAGRK